MTHIPDQAGQVAAPVGRYAAAVVLTTAVAGIVIVGFLGSYGPLRDAFLAIHQSRSAAARDPLAVDGLIAVAVASAIWLRHEAPARRYALTVAGVTTGASLLLNFLHGQGVIQPGGLVHQPLHPLLVFTIASLPVAAIGFGSHLLVACLRQLGAPVGGPVQENVGRRPAERPPVRPPSASTAGTGHQRPSPRTKSVPSSPSQDNMRRQGDGQAATGPDPALVALGRKAFAELRQDGVPATRDALRARIRVGTGKASAVWAVLQNEGVEGE